MKILSLLILPLNIVAFTPNQSFIKTSSFNENLPDFLKLIELNILDGRVNGSVKIDSEEIIEIDSLCKKVKIEKYHYRYSFVLLNSILPGKCLQNGIKKIEIQFEVQNNSFLKSKTSVFAQIYKRDFFCLPEYSSIMISYNSL